MYKQFKPEFNSIATEQCHQHSSLCASAACTGSCMCGDCEQTSCVPLGPIGLLTQQQQ